MGAFFFSYFFIIRRETAPTMIEIFRERFAKNSCFCYTYFAGNCNATGGLSSLIFVQRGAFFSLSSLYKREVMSR